MEDKKTLFSAVQPSGTPTIGNYVGAINNFVKLQDEYNCIYSIADLHCLTVKQDPQKLKRSNLIMRLLSEQNIHLHQMKTLELNYLDLLCLVL